MKDTKQEFSVIDIENIVRKHYVPVTAVTPLPGFDDINYRIEDRQGKRYTLKISPAGTDPALVELQIRIAGHLASRLPELHFPDIILTYDKKSWFTRRDRNGDERIIRLQQWVPGRPLGSVTPRSREILIQWGTTCGKLSAALQDFDHPAAHRYYEWDPAQTLHVEKLLGYLENREDKEAAGYFLDLFRKTALPQLPHLRKSVNYNDAHDLNLLVDDDPRHPAITGIIDFEDTVYTQTVHELAIACAYAIQGMADPLEAAEQVIQGYHRIFPLQEEEVEVLFPLIAARLLISVSHTARNKVLRPDNIYLQTNADTGREALRKLREISPALAHYTFRQACGMQPVLVRRLYDRWIKANKKRVTPVIRAAEKKTVRPDLSVGSKDLGHFTAWQDVNHLTAAINRIMYEAGAGLAVGGYGEVRPFYTTDAFSVSGNNGRRWRTVHLGTDIWTPADTPVAAPLDSRVHSFRDNPGERDYGPAIILEHTQEEVTFYTLYGHLSRDSLAGLQEGRVIRQGETFARVGAPPANGNWPPHLHFQVILDMLGHKGDFPGTATPETTEVWLDLCPDGEPFLGIKGLPPKPDHLQAEKILEQRQKILGPNLSISYKKPLHMVRGQMQYLLDVYGRRYLDTVNNVAHVGHEHPRVVAAAQKQIAVLNTNTRYLHENIVQYANDLLATFPPELSVVYFVNSGSEANELAIRMAETVTGQKDMIAVEVGYHGNTGRAISVSSYKFDRHGGSGAPPHTHIVPMPDVYRGRYRDPETSGEQYAAHVRSAVDSIHKKGNKPAGFICESILSCGGQIVLPEGYLAHAYRAVHDAGGLCIADEVQVGFGRVGKTFWGFELQGVVPDIVTLGKPIGNGHPLGAVVTTRAVADAFNTGMEYFNTYGGNPVSCAIGHEVLRIIHDEDLQQHALKTGIYLKEALEELMNRNYVIGDVRGGGLFLGFEMVRDREKRIPATEEADYLINRMREQGILMSSDGPDENVIKIKPPMCISRTNIAFLIDTLDKILQEDFLRK